MSEISIELAAALRNFARYAEFAHGAVRSVSKRERKLVAQCTHNQKCGDYSSHFRCMSARPLPLLTRDKFLGREHWNGKQKWEDRCKQRDLSDQDAPMEEAPSYAGLFTAGSETREQICRDFSGASLFSRQDRGPPLRRNPIALPPLGDHAG
jgi:hypothetical protein